MTTTSPHWVIEKRERWPAWPALAMRNGERGCGRSSQAPTSLKIAVVSSHKETSDSTKRCDSLSLQVQDPPFSLSKCPCEEVDLEFRGPNQLITANCAGLCLACSDDSIIFIRFYKIEIPHFSRSTWTYSRIPTALWTSTQKATAHFVEPPSSAVASCCSRAWMLFNRWVLTSAIYLMLAIIKKECLLPLLLGCAKVLSPSAGYIRIQAQSYFF